MKFLINTNYKSAGTNVLNGIEKRIRESGYELVLNDWDNYDKYDVVFFMAPDSKVREAKEKNPKLLCILFDPKVTLMRQIKEVESADLLIVSSIEQRDHLLKYNKNILIYYMFPDTKEIKKEHKDQDKIIIGYHGNKQHLSSMRDVSWALDELSKTHNIELQAIYNVKKLGKWNKNLPKVCKVEHVQWSEEIVVDTLTKSDIGIVPSVSPTSSIWSRPISSFFYNPEGYSNNDYVVRFKFSNNPGRIYVFSQLYVPVVTDFTPSSCQMIKNGESGFLVGAKEGWYEALKNLADDAKLRNSFSQNLKKNIDENYSIDKNFESLMSLIKIIIKDKI